MSQKRESLQNIIDFADKIERDLKIARRYANPVNSTITSTPFIVGRDDLYLKDIVETEDGKRQVIVTDNPWEAVQFPKAKAVTLAADIWNGNGFFQVTDVQSEAKRFVARFEPVLAHVKEWLSQAS